MSLLRLFVSSSQFSLHAFQKPPIIVRLIDPPKDPTGLADVLVGALGLTGVILLIAVILGIVLAGVMFWVRARET